MVPVSEYRLYKTGISQTFWQMSSFGKTVSKHYNKCSVHYEGKSTFSMMNKLQFSVRNSCVMMSISLQTNKNGIGYVIVKFNSEMKTPDVYLNTG